MNKLLIFFSLFRPQNMLILAFTQCLIFYRFFPNTDLLSNIIICLCSTLILGTGNLINDYFDLEIDQVNKPQKHLFTSVLSPKQLITTYIGINFLVILLSLPFSFLLSTFYIGSIILLFFYSYAFKQKVLIGNLIVALLTASHLIYLGYFHQKIESALWVFTIFSFMMTLIRELIKDVEDREGDKQLNCKTFPILFGIEKSRILVYLYIVSLFITLFVSTSESTLFLYWKTLISLALFYLIFQVYQHNDEKSFARSSSLCKKIMIIGSLGIIFV
ncbi:MAG: UbiA family prenyltransferase [Cytophagales bacterium]|nr:UbiA family prenyltransferase [Cytophagales bacterium]